MVFSSTTFLLAFLPLVAILYYICLLYTSDAADE